MAERKVVCGAIEFGVHDGPEFITEIRSTPDGRTLCHHGQQRILVRTLLDPSEPAFLSAVRLLPSPEGTVRLLFADQEGKYTADLLALPSPGGVQLTCTVKGAKPVWLFEWRISSLHVDEVIVPALGGQSLSSSMPADTTMSYKYPFWWNAQFVIGQAGDGGLWLQAKETEARLKLLRVQRAADGFMFTYGVEAQAPVRRKRLDATWYLDAYKGDWTIPMERHRQWLAEAFAPVPLTANRYVPGWFRQITMVLELWGMRKDQGIPHHTYAQMAERLHEWQKLYSPEQTLLYLPGFAEHGIDSNAPDYNPSTYLGGADGFRRLVDEAHRLGFRVMIHTNVLAMTFTHKLYPRFKRHQVIDAFGRPQTWGLDMDGDWLAEPYFAYINPGAAAWSALMKKTLGRLIKRFQVDGVFLDQTLLAFNTSRGPNFLEGMRAHVGRLQKAFPDVLFAGEGLHEQVLSILPMAQIHGIDSIAEVHALDGQVRWRNAHPVSTKLFGPFTRFVAHLLTRHPSHPMFALQEASYAALGVLPALCLYDHRQPMDTPETRAMIARAKSIPPITKT